MGCISSKHVKEELRREELLKETARRCAGHVVSLTSTTYGELNLEKDLDLPSHSQPQLQDESEMEKVTEKEKEKENDTETETEKEKEEEQEQQREGDEALKPISPERESEEKPLEVINTWELMGDLEEETVISNNGTGNQDAKNTPKPVKSFLEARSPLKFLNQIGTPRKARTYGGKENKVRRGAEFSPKPPLKGATPKKPSKVALKLSYTPVSKRPASNCFSNELPPGTNGSKWSASPMFDPDLVARYERELTEEEEQIKRVIRMTPRTKRLQDTREKETILSSFELKCPPGGEDSLVLYSTTLRGIRKTFEECNVARSIFQSYYVHYVERDVSMDSGFREELRNLMGARGTIVPAVFLKGRFIGGSEKLVQLEEDGKLAMLLAGMPRDVSGACDGCGGIRFVLCMACNGSTKVLQNKGLKVVRCGKCNENGLIRCPICC